MKRKMIAAALAGMMMVSLAACGQREPGMDAASEEIQNLVQTGTLEDYGNYVRSLGQYAGLEINVPEYTVTAEQLEEFKEQAVQFYNSYYGNGEAAAEWTDEIAKAVSGGKYESAKEYEAYVKETLEEDAREKQEQAFLDGIWEKILENTDLGELPMDEIEEDAQSYYESQKKQFEYYATYYSQSYEDYLADQLDMTDEQFRQYCSDVALTEKKRVYIASEIFREQNMSLDDEAFSKGVSELVEKFGYDSSEEFVEKFGEDYIREYLVHEMVNDYLLENNVMNVEK